MSIKIESLEERRLLSVSLNGTTKVLTIAGTSGADTASVSLSGTKITAKLGSETKSYLASAIAKIVFTGGAGKDTFNGGNVNKPMSLDGGDHDDSLTGGLSADTITGGSGNDWADGGAGADTMSGGAGFDYVTYSKRTAGVTVDLDGVADDGAAGEKDNCRTDIEGISGSSAGDKLTGTAASNIIKGNAGNDILAGLGGADTLDGGTGNDTMDGGTGDDKCVGGAGADKGHGGSGFDDLDSSDTQDVYDDTDEIDGPAELEREGRIGSGEGSSTVSKTQFGTIVSVDVAGAKLTVSAAADGGAVTTKTLSVDPAAKITIDEKPGSLAALLAGAKVNYKTLATNANVLTEISVKGSVVEGKVLSVDLTANTITLKGETARTFTLAADAVITIGETPGTLAGVLPNADVRLQLSGLDGKVTKLQVRTTPPPVDGAVEISGKLGSVDATAGTITILREGVPETFAVPAATQIFVNGVAGKTLADVGALGTNVKVELKFTVDSAGVRTLVRIKASRAEAPPVVGQKGFGSVVSVDVAGNTITLSVRTTDNGPLASKTFNTTAATRVTIDGKPATLAALVPAAKVYFTTVPGDPTTLAEISVASSVVEGRVQSVDATAGTITLKGDVPRVFTVAAGAVILVNEQPGTLAGILPNASVRLVLSGLTGQAIEVKAKLETPPPPTPAASGKGTISSLDLANNKITLSIAIDGNAAATRTFNVTATTKVTIDGKPATLAKLTAGAKVSYKTVVGDATTLAEITIASTVVEGRVLSVNAAAGTITLKGDAPKTYALAAGAVVTVNGVVGTLAGVLPNAEVKLVLSGVSGQAIEVIAKNPNPETQPPPTQGTTGKGAVAGVDVAGGKVTLNIPVDGNPGATKTFTVTTTTKILVDGKVTPLASLPLALKVTFKTVAGAADTLAELTATGPAIEGRVLSANAAAGTITLKPTDGFPAGRTFAIPATAEVKLNGALGTLAAIPLNAEVRLQLSAIDATTVISISAKFEGNSGPGGGEH